MIGVLPDRPLAAALVPVAVLVLAADPRFINFDDAAELDFRRDQRGADFVAHGMGRLVATEAHHALYLKGAHSLLARQHQMGDAIPVAEGLLGVFENRPAEAREPIAVLCALPALPVKRLVAGGIVQVRIAAARAMDAFRPAPGHQVVKAGFIVTDREPGLNLGRGHLRDWFRSFRHDCYPNSVGGYCHA